MGTNYYKVKTLTREEKDKLIDSINNDRVTIGDYGFICFRDENDKDIILPKKEIHIGKRSCGWKFLFDHNNWDYYPRDKAKFVEWVNDMSNGRIMDEYGNEYSPRQFWEEKVMPTYTDKWIDGTGRLDSDSYNKRLKESGKMADGINDFYLEDLRFSLYTDFS